MLILILVDVQLLQNVVFSFETALNGQNHSSSDSHYLIKKNLPPAKLSIPSPLNTISKTLMLLVRMMLKRAKQITTGQKLNSEMVPSQQP